MITLSQQDRVTVAEYPLHTSLHFLEDRLREAEKPSTDPQSLQAAVSLLLTALMGHKAAFHLQSKAGHGNLALQLLKVLSNVQTHEFRDSYFRPLSLLVVERRPDIDIWEAVFNVAHDLLSSTPPTSKPVSSEETPTIRSSSSFQGREQTRRALNDALFDEIKTCTYRKVSGFLEKYFGNKRWERKSRGIFGSVQRETKRRAKWYDSNANRWIGLSDQPEEQQMWDWLARFQTEFLSHGPSEFHGAKRTSNLTGGEAKRQLDVLMARRDGRSMRPEDKDKTRYDWKKVLVIGELKQSVQDFKPLLLQLCRYARDIFTAQPTRQFVHAFTLQGRAIECWVFDRSGPYSSGEIDIHQEPLTFIKIIFGYINMTDAELGLDTFMKLEGGKRFITISASPSEKEIQLELEETPFVKQRAIVCRGTTCFRTKDLRNVVKFSWASDRRPCESELLHLARERKVAAVAQFVGYRRLTTIAELRSELVFSDPHAFRRTRGQSFSSASQSLSRSFGAFQRLSVSTFKRKYEGKERDGHKRSRSNTQESIVPQSSQGVKASMEQRVSLYDNDIRTYSNRVFGCLAIYPAGKALSEFESVEELLTALRDAHKGHRSLLLEANIIHRDVSENNIIITDPAVSDGLRGMLIDLDLGKVVGSARSGARHQTGTVQFMAIQVLQKTAHTFRHDLESFFYVLLWTCARRSWEVGFGCSPSNSPKRSILRKWYSGEFEEIAHAKQGDMHADGLEDILKEFPPSLECVKQLCREIRKIMFPLRPDGRLDTGTLTDAEELYSQIIQTYDDVLVSL